MSEQATLVVTAVPNPEGMASVQEYLKGILPLLIGAGGKPVKRLKTTAVLNGRPSGMTLVMDFESAEAINRMFDSDDYKALVETRDRGFSEMNILVAQEM